MAAVLLDMVISLDGLVCGPGGADGGLHDWYFNPRRSAGQSSTSWVSTTGAIIVGRGAFGAGDAAGGWDDTPYQVPHFVVTHRPPQPAPRGMVEFIFVPDGVRAAVERAQEAAGDHDATI
jgi:dihydrofolate reductase